MLKRAAAVVLLGLLAAGCAPSSGPIYVVSPQAVQKPWPDTLPHLDRRGAVLTRFDPQRSVFTLALGGALVDYRQGVARGRSGGRGGAGARRAGGAAAPAGGRPAPAAPARAPPPPARRAARAGARRGLGPAGPRPAAPGPRRRPACHLRPLCWRSPPVG